MHCYVYACARKPDSYLWLTRRDDFDVIGEPLALLLGDMRLVLEVELDAQRRLPQEDTTVVLEHLREQGWHLQLPPKETLATANHLVYRSGASADRDS